MSKSPLSIKYNISEQSIMNINDVLAELAFPGFFIADKLDDDGIVLGLMITAFFFPITLPCAAVFGTARYYFDKHFYIEGTSFELDDGSSDEE